MASSQERATHGFVERHGLWSDEQVEAAAKVDRLIEERALEVVRLSFPDQHGILRGKTAMAGDAAPLFLRRASRRAARPLVPRRAATPACLDCRIPVC